MELLRCPSVVVISITKGKHASRQNAQRVHLILHMMQGFYGGQPLYLTNKQLARLIISASNPLLQLLKLFCFWILYLFIKEEIWRGINNAEKHNSDGNKIVRGRNNNGEIIGIMERNKINRKKIITWQKNIIDNIRGNDIRSFMVAIFGSFLIFNSIFKK